MMVKRLRLQQCHKLVLAFEGYDVVNLVHRTHTLERLYEFRSSSQAVPINVNPAQRQQ